MKIGIFYGSTTGNTATIAGRLAEMITTARLYPVAETTRADFEACDLLILGTSSWCDEEDRLQDDWNDSYECLRSADLRGKKVAVYGVGDQLGYPDAFVDGIRALHDLVLAAGGTIIGKYPDEGYDYSASAAVEGDFFLGLPLDPENQDALTEGRLAEWVEQLHREAVI